MEYGKVYLTEEGKKLAAKTLQSKTLKFLNFKVGSGEIDNIESIEGLTDLVNPILSFNITKVSTETDTQVAAKGVFSNINVTEDFYLKELGLYAKDPDTSNSILFAYVNFGDKAEFIADKNTERKEIYYDLLISVGNSNSVEININSETIYATEKDLEDTKVELNKELGKKIHAQNHSTSSLGSYVLYSDGSMRCWKIIEVEAGGTKWTDTLYYSDHNMGKWPKEFKTLISSKATVLSKQFWCTQEEQSIESAGTVRCFRPNATKAHVKILIEAWGYYIEDYYKLHNIDSVWVGEGTKPPAYG